MRQRREKGGRQDIGRRPRAAGEGNQLLVRPLHQAARRLGRCTRRAPDAGERAPHHPTSSPPAAPRARRATGDAPPSSATPIVLGGALVIPAGLLMQRKGCRRGRRLVGRCRGPRSYRAHRHTSRHGRRGVRVGSRGRLTSPRKMRLGRDQHPAGHRRPHPALAPHRGQKGRAANAAHHRHPQPRSSTD